MPKTRHTSFLISCLLLVLALAGFWVILFLAVFPLPSLHSELQLQLVRLGPVGPAEERADTIIRRH